MTILTHNPFQANIPILYQETFGHKMINMHFDEENITWAHRVRNKYTDENTEKKVQSIIIKCELLKSREEFYINRPKTFIDDKNKSKLKLLQRFWWSNK